MVRPLVMTQSMYADITGESDPEELSLMQVQDREIAEQVAGVLSDLYGIDSTLLQPRDEEGLDLVIGTLEDIGLLRAIAAAMHGKTEADYQEGRVPAGFQFNHLINHAGDSGFYVPVDFMQAFVVGDISVGSAVALLQELAALEPVLAESYPEEYRIAVEATDDDLVELEGPVGVWWTLRQLCRSAVELDLPIHLG